ncbi:hypothetical protein FE394_18915 [Xenorhabdus sp. Reich]|uniref:Uncharacterized protein n=1 Tax=Xenorhabdus littoralis TaxID=2582835 RepID=A0ABU4SRE9_9GAMM|nr:hypothetical protein [Xenorhabdus sp. Reich]
MSGGSKGLRTLYDGTLEKGKSASFGENIIGRVIFVTLENVGGRQFGFFPIGNMDYQWGGGWDGFILINLSGDGRTIRVVDEGNYCRLKKLEVLV